MNPHTNNDRVMGIHIKNTFNNLHGEMHFLNLSCDLTTG